jgi:signal transduction histidine kinase
MWRRAGRTPSLTRSIVIGTALTAVALVVKRIVFELVGYDIAYLILYAAVPVAAILGGFPAGLVVVVMGSVADAGLFHGPIADLGTNDPGTAWRLVLFIPIGTWLAWLIASGGAARRDAVAVGERFAALLGAMPDFAVLVDPVGRRIEYASDGVSALGWAPVALIGRDIDEVIPDLGPLDQAMPGRSTAATGLLSPIGEELPVEVATALVQLPSGGPRLLVTARDSRARIDAEVRLIRLAAAERSHARVMEAVIGAMDDGVALIGADSRVIMANDALVTLLGRPVSSRDDLLAALGQLDDGERTLPGTERWVSLRVYPVDDATALQPPTLVVARDVTEQRRAAAAQDAFIGVLSHELRTPVTTIVGISQLLRRPARGGVERDTVGLMADLADEATRLSQLIEDLLVLSRAQSGRITADLEPVLVGRIVAEAVAVEADRYPSVRFEVDVPRHLPPVDGDPTYLRQVLRNIIGNAGKYGPPGSVVTVRAAATDDAVTITVVDEGPGFDPEDTPHLFDIFFRSARTARQHSGSGIGLYVARTLVEAMGGTIWARSLEEGGSEFGLVLPVIDSVEAPMPASQAR